MSDPVVTPIVADPTPGAQAGVAEITTPAVTESPASVAPSPAEAPPALRHHSDTPTLLGEAKFTEAPDPRSAAADPAAPVETPPAAEVKPLDPADPAKTETKPEEPAVAVDVPKPEPVVYEFKVPDGIEASAEDLQRATTVLNELGISRDVGPRVLEAHYAEMRRAELGFSQRVNDQFLQLRTTEKARYANDPIMGRPEALNAALRMRDALVPEADRPDFDRMITVTGAGDFLAMGRLLYRVNELVEHRVAEALKPYRESSGPAPSIGVPKNIGQNPALRGARLLYSEDPASTGSR